MYLDIFIRAYDVQLPSESIFNKSLLEGNFCFCLSSVVTFYKQYWETHLNAYIALKFLRELF